LNREAFLLKVDCREKCRTKNLLLRKANQPSVGYDIRKRTQAGVAELLHTDLRIGGRDEAQARFQLPQGQRLPWQERPSISFAWK